MAEPTHPMLDSGPSWDVASTRDDKFFSFASACVNACSGLDATELASLPPGEMRRLLAEVVAHSPDLTLAIAAKHLLGTKTEER